VQTNKQHTVEHPVRRAMTVFLVIAVGGFALDRWVFHSPHNTSGKILVPLVIGVALGLSNYFSSKRLKDP
jgi:hypothetical protein